MNNKKSILILSIIFGISGSTQCMQEEIPVEDTLLPYAEKQLLKLAQEQPGLFTCLLDIKNRQEKSYLYLSCIGSVKTLYQQGFLVASVSRSLACHDLRDVEGVRVVGVFQRVFPTVLCTLRELTLHAREHEPVTTASVDVQLPAPSAPPAPEGLATQCSRLALTEKKS